MSRSSLLSIWCFCTLIAAILASSLLGADLPSDEGVEFFEKQIRAVLVEHCYECHSGDVAKPKGQLRLDSRAATRKGGESGPAIVPGNVEESLLIDAIQHESLEMPPDKKLSPAVIADFKRWVEMGAPDPRDAAVRETGEASSWSEILEKRKQWWSLQPVQVYPLPSVRNESWSSNPIDRFLLAKLEAEGLQPAPPADARALARRLTFLLTGLPPDPDKAEASRGRFYTEQELQRHVDQLLCSPQFGERWARHWMDVVGFAETHGHEWNFELRDAWRYRDYLIRAFNDDVPFDRLIREHIAGDQLAETRWNEYEGINESLIGTTFFRFGEIDHDDCRLFPAISLDVIDQQIDRLSKAFQATTVACARCHDHKLDAISMEDYYALSGVLASSRNVVHTIDLPHRNRDLKEKLRRLKTRIREELATLWRDELVNANEYLLAAQIRISQPENRPVERSASLDPNRLTKWTAMLKAANERAAKNKNGQLTIDEFEFPWLELSKLPTPSELFAKRWDELRNRFASERRKRIQFNATNFVTLADFRSEMDPAWQANGLAIQEGITQSGDFSVNCQGDPIVRAILPAGFHSHRLSTRLNASLYSPQIPKANRYVSFEVLGGQGGVWRHVYNNCAIQNAISQQLRSDVFRWQRVSTIAEEADLRSVIELATKFDDQGFPYLNHNKIVDADDDSSYFGIGRVVAHDGDASPKSELKHLSALFAGPAFNTVEELAERYATVLQDSVKVWGKQSATDQDVYLINWMLEHELLLNMRTATAALSQLTEEYRRTEAQLKPGRSIAGVAEFESGFDVPSRIRGDAFSPGSLVARRYVQVLSVASTDEPASGSGRLQLANHLASEQNPLTARVYVNRIWHHVFGTGLVRTPDDFGRLGEAPTHPELLDYLARRFVEQGWSTKDLIRLLVTSRAFQMSSTPSTRASERDPGNRWLHHYPMRRLEAEAIRDSILAVSGQLDRQLYGRSIHPHRFDERPMRRLFNGPLDGNGRRSIYLKITLTEEPPFLSVFNLPDPKATKGRRDMTNVPAQALALLNDPFVAKQAEAWAKRLLSQACQSVDDRLRDMFLTAVSRPPTDRELDRFRDVTLQFAALHSVPVEDLLESERVWKDVAHLFFNMKEFIFVR